MSITINNSKEASTTGSWSNPGASLFDKLLAEPNYKALITEAYLRVPNSLTKESTYSGSGVGYPHHVVRNGDGKLVLHRRGVIAAYSRAKQQGIFTGALAAHLTRHYKELGLYEDSTMEHTDIFSAEDFINQISKNPQRENSGKQFKHTTIKSSLQKMLKLREEYPDINEWSFGRMMNAAKRISMPIKEIRNTLAIQAKSNMELDKFVDMFIEYMNQERWEQETKTAVASHSVMTFVDFLEHHGVPGMQWGVRRKRGPDGRRTGPPMSTEEYMRRQAQRQTGGTQQTPDTRSEDKRAADEARRKAPSQMSNNEMQTIVKRFNLEKQLREVTQAERTRGKRIMDRAMKELTDVAWNVAKAQLTKKANQMFEDLAARRKAS